MEITWDKLDIGEWVDVSKSYHKKNKQTFLELRLKKINKCIGKIYISENGCNVRALFSTESDGCYSAYNQKIKVEELKNEWKLLMNALLKKYFK